MENTLVIIKPDAVVRCLIGEITSRFEKKGLKLVGCRMVTLTQELLNTHYSHLSDKPFFPRIAKFMSSQPVLIQCWQGVDAVSVVRECVGVTNGREASPGTVRGDYSMSVQCNLVHASDTPENAAIEVERFFSKEEIIDYKAFNEYYLYASDELG